MRGRRSAAHAVFPACVGAALAAAPSRQPTRRHKNSRCDACCWRGWRPAPACVAHTAVAALAKLRCTGGSWRQRGNALGCLGRRQRAAPPGAVPSGALLLPGAVLAVLQNGRGAVTVMPSSWIMPQKALTRHACVAGAHVSSCRHTGDKQGVSRDSAPAAHAPTPPAPRCGMLPTNAC